MCFAVPDNMSYCFILFYCPFAFTEMQKNFKDKIKNLAACHSNIKSSQRRHKLPISDIAYIFKCN